MKTTNADRLRNYKERMKAKGFIRLNIWTHPSLQELLVKERQPGECYGRTLERLILAKRFARPGDRWHTFRYGQENDIDRAGFPDKPERFR